MVESGKKWYILGKWYMFFGEFEYKIDEKGRVPIPPKFRSELRDGVVVTPGIERCLTAYPLPEWKKLAASLTASGVNNDKMRRLNRIFFATAFHLRVDNQGRIPLPHQLREHAGIGDEVVMAGANNYFELWDKSQWATEKAAGQEQAWQIIESLEKRE